MTVLPNASVGNSPGASARAQSGNATTQSRAVALQNNTNSQISNSDIASLSSAQVTKITRDPEGGNVLPPPNFQTGIRITATTDNYRPIDNKGLNEQRPEILATFQLEPVFNDDDDVPGDVGELLDIRIASRRLRAENIIRLMNELKVNQETADIIEQLENRVKTETAAAQSEVSFLNEMVRHLGSVRDSLRIKANDQRIKTDTSLRRKRGNTGNKADSLQTRERSAKSPREIMSQELGFSNEGLSGFTDTKIIAQMLDDLRVIASSFSPQIFDGLNEERARDDNSTSIMRLDDHTIGAASEFNIETLASSRTQDVVDSVSRATTTKFLNSFSSLTDPDNRLKILFNILSKEVRISAGLSIDSIRHTLQDSFGLSTTEGNVFFDVIGNIGEDTLSSVPPRESSLMSLLRVSAGDDVVLPFEQITTKQLYSARRFVPGRSFYVDSILQGEVKFQTEALNEYARSFHIGANGLATIVEGLLDVNVINNDRLGLSVSDLMVRVFTPIKDELLKLGGGQAPEDARFSAGRDAFTPALLSLAHTDPEMKHLLYLYLLLYGFESIQNENINVESKIFETLIDVGLTPEVVIEEVRRIALEPLEREAAGNQELANMGLDVAGGQVYSAGPQIERVRNAPAMTLITDLIMGKIINNFRKDSIDPNKEEFLASFEFARMASFGSNFRSTYLFNTMFDVINNVDILARTAISGNRSRASNADGYFSELKPALTKFSGLGANTIILLVLEIFTTLFAQFAPATITGAKLTQRLLTGEPLSAAILTESPRFELELNREAINEMYHVVANFMGDLSLAVSHGTLSNDALMRANQRLADFREIKAKAVREDTLIRDIVDSIVSIANRLLESTQETTRFFDPSGRNATVLNSLLATVDANDKLASLDPAQVTLSRVELREQQAAITNTSFLVNALNDSTESNELSPFIDDSTILQTVRDAMFSMFRQPQLRSTKGQNAQIISIGLPAGFTESLQKRLSTFTAGQDVAEINRRLGLQNDVIKVSVYMQDMRLDDIAFKPQTFIFEMDRFVSNTSFSQIRENEGRSFDSLIQDVIQQVVLSRDASRFDVATGKDSTSAASYSFLSETEKAQLAKNHVMDYLLSTYIKLLTGVEMREKSFLMNEQVSAQRVDIETRKIFENLLTTHVSQFVPQPISLDDLRASNKDVDDLLTRIESDEITAGLLASIESIFPEQPSGANIEIAQDLVTFISTFSPASILFGSGIRRQRVVSPKTFERIFNILIDPDDFEIDIEKTLQTRAGEAALNSLFNANGTRVEPTNVLDPTNRLMGSGRFGNFREQVFRDYSNKRTQGDVSFRQFFVSIEQLPVLPAINVTQTPTPRIASTPSYQQGSVSRNSRGVVVLEGAVVSDDTRFNVTKPATRSEIRAAGDVVRKTDPSKGRFNIL